MFTDYPMYRKTITDLCASAWQNHMRFAMELVLTTNPQTIVDLGVDEGYSTFSFAYPNIGTVYSVDNFLGDSHTGDKETLRHVNMVQYIIREHHGINNIQFVPLQFDHFAMMFNKQIDILHIDGQHNFENVSYDFDTFFSFLHENSVVLFHDIDTHSDVKDFFNSLEDYKFVRPQSCGLGVWCKNKELLEKIKELSDKFED